MTKRSDAKAATRERILAVAYGLFTHNVYEAVTIRLIAAEMGMSTGAVFASFAGKAEVYEAAFGFPYPWKPIAQAKKDGELCLLLVDYSEGANRAEIEAHASEELLWEGRPLEDALIGRTVGHNNLEHDGEDRWQFAGWCWSQDHYTQGQGTPIAFIPLDQAAALPAQLADSHGDGGSHG